MGLIKFALCVFQLYIYNSPQPLLRLEVLNTNRSEPSQSKSGITRFWKPVGLKRVPGKLSSRSILVGSQLWIFRTSTCSASALPASIPLYNHATSLSSDDQRASCTSRAALVFPVGRMQAPFIPNKLPRVLMFFIVSKSNGTTKTSLLMAMITCLPSCETWKAFSVTAEGKLVRVSTVSVL